jgi:hypothetical protein
MGKRGKEQKENPTINEDIEKSSRECLWLAFGQSKTGYPNYEQVSLINESAQLASILVPRPIIVETQRLGAERYLELGAFTSYLAFGQVIVKGEDHSFLTAVGYASEDEFSTLIELMRIDNKYPPTKRHFIGVGILYKHSKWELNADFWQAFVNHVRQYSFHDLTLSQYPIQQRLTRAEVRGNREPLKEDYKLYSKGFENYHIPVWWYTYYRTRLQIDTGEKYRMEWRKSLLGKLWTSVIKSNRHD